jgi:hypothetical protein
MSSTVVIRARPETRDLLNRLAREDGATAIDTLDGLIRNAAEARLLAGLAADLAAVPERGQEDLAVWDAALADGLDPDEDFSAWR